jgi:hypothetical protein
MLTLDRALLRVARRLRVRRALGAAIVSAAAATPLAIALAVLTWLHVLAPTWGRRPVPLEVLVLATIAGGFLIGLVAGLVRRVDRRTAAAVLDHAGGHGALFATALDLPPDNRFAPLVRAEAERALAAAQGKGLRRAAPLRPAGRGLRALAAGVFVAFAVSLLPPLQRGADQQARAMAELTPERTAELERLQARMARLGDERGIDGLERAAAQLSGFSRDLADSRLTELEALARLGEVEEELRAERERIEARARVAERLDAAPARAALAAADGLSSASPAARAEARAALARAADEAGALPELQALLRGAARSLESTAPAGDDVEALDALRRGLAELPAEHVDDLARAEVDRAAAEIDSLRDAFSRGDDTRLAKAPEDQQQQPVVEPPPGTEPTPVAEESAPGENPGPQGAPGDQPKPGDPQPESAPGADPGPQGAPGEQPTPGDPKSETAPGEGTRPHGAQGEQPTPGDPKPETAPGEGTRPQGAPGEPPKPETAPGEDARPQGAPEQPKLRDPQPQGAPGATQPEPGDPKPETPRPRGELQTNPDPQATPPKPGEAKPPASDPQQASRPPAPDRDRDPSDEPGGEREPPPELLLRLAESMGEELLRGLDAKTLADMAELAKSMAGDDGAPPPPPRPDQARDLADRFQGLDRDVQKKLLDVAAQLRQGAPDQGQPRPDGQGATPPPALDPAELQERLAGLDPAVRSRLEDLARAEAERSGAQRPGAAQGQPGRGPSTESAGTSTSTETTRPLGVGPATTGGGPDAPGEPVASADPSAGSTPGEPVASADPTPDGATPPEQKPASGRTIYAPAPGDPEAAAALPDDAEPAARPVGDQLHGEEEETAGARRRAAVPFEQAVQAAEASALEALGRQRVPEAYERAVREYFDRAQRSERPAEPR